jgi:hypothetical protein
VYKHGADTTYKNYVFGNALTFAQTQIRIFTSNDYELRGMIVYYDISVPQVFYGAGAVVESCVNASGLYRVNAASGKTVGTIFTGGYNHYQEQAAAGKKPNGLWIISHTSNYPATSGGTAGMCTA